MSSERVFTPLSQANTDRVKTNLKLPYHLEENIGLDTKKVEMLCQIGGIAQLSIRNDNSRSSPTIVGVTSSGVALGGSTRTESVSKETNTKNSKIRLASARWSNLEIAIKDEVLVTKIESQKKDLKDPTNWAIAIDSSVKNGISSAAFQNLIKRNLKRCIVSNTLAGSWLIFDILTKNYSGAVVACSLWQLLDRQSDIICYASKSLEKEKDGRYLYLNFRN